LPPPNFFWGGGVATVKFEFLMSIVVKTNVI
jgi:hypothetical protein